MRLCAFGVGLRLGSGQSECANTIGDALRSIGPEVIPALITALRDTNQSVRENAAGVLGTMYRGASPAVPALIAALGDTNCVVRSQAAEALGHIGPPAASAVPTLLATLRDPKPEVRASAASVIGNIVPPTEPVVSALIATLKDRKPDVRSIVVRSLGKVVPPTEATVAAVVASLSDGNYSVRKAAMGAVEEMLWGTNGSRFATHHESHGASGAGTVAVPLIESAIPALTASLKESSPYMRAKAACALARIGAASSLAVPALVKAMGDERCALVETRSHPFARGNWRGG